MSGRPGGATRMQPLFDGNLCFCPLCDDWFVGSDYLASVFENPRALWVANMVTHYRHRHVDYYNRHVGYASWSGRYDEFKHLVNERAKRQVIRKARHFLREHRIAAEHFAELQGTTEETLALASRMLGGGLPPGPAVVALRRGQLTLEEWA